MPTVRATCLVCDDTVRVPVTRVTLHRRRARDVRGHYGFTCPVCEVFVVRRATASVVEALLAADAPHSIGDLPPWERPDGADVVVLDDQDDQPEQLPPISETEIELFAAVIADDAALVAWLAD